MSVATHPGATQFTQDPSRRQFTRQALCQTDQRAFGHGIVGVQRLAPLPRGRTDQHDMPPRSVVRPSPEAPAVPSAPPPPAPVRTPSPGSRPSCSATAPRSSARSAHPRPARYRDSPPARRAGQMPSPPPLPARVHPPACSTPAQSATQRARPPHSPIRRMRLLLCLPIAEDHPRARRREQPHRLRANPARTARNQRNLPIQYQRHTSHSAKLKHSQDVCRGWVLAVGGTETNKLSSHRTPRDQSWLSPVS